MQRHCNSRFALFRVKKEIGLGGDYYDMDDVQQLEVLTEGAECAELTPSKFQSLSSLITKLPLVANRELLAIEWVASRLYFDFKIFIVYK